ncbi:hypothetical protein AB205_0163230 [Aquarana catesbeiana]|uniref:Integrin alpha third immunoglobulin-like domain-containing protein n=1 Tax=Aquarana catesbeiana TaxID=8400 RepID=A0A2G9SGD9_AQUCT|nr:hypothetical protein AB205_0163230 [Aquarana catesbeiana]
MLLLFLPFSRSAQAAEVFLPLPKWKPREESSKAEYKGKIVTHVYELYNVGPGTLNAKLVVRKIMREMSSCTHYV